MSKKPLFILISGPSCTAKSKMARELGEKIGVKTAVLEMDMFAHSITNPENFTGFGDFNKPENLNKEEFLKQLNSLLSGKEAVSVADFDREKSKKIEPSKIIVAEGGHALQHREIRNMADLKIYVNSDDDLKLIWKIQRSPYYKDLIGEPKKDPRNYGKNFMDAFDIWKKKSKPSYKKYIEPTKAYADLAFHNNTLEDFYQSLEKVTNLTNLYFENEPQFRQKVAELRAETKKQDPQYLIKELKQRLDIAKREIAFWIIGSILVIVVLVVWLMLARRKKVNTV